MLHTPIQHHLYLLRGRQVLLDFDLASLFDLSTKRLNQIVNRNRTRFPEDFAFRLTSEEFSMLIQLRPANSLRFRKLCYPPHAYTISAALTLSFLLGSKRDIHAGIALARAFTRSE